ncbi:MAG: hypothetical protein RLZZ214_4267 [Verrucomicrobiota bacterium]|jgi:hypothetical protein
MPPRHSHKNALFRILRVLAVVTVATSGIRHATAAVHFVAPDGDDAADGSIGKPLASLHEANDRAMPGDNVFLRGGSYRLPAGQTIGITINKSGKQGKPITFSAYRDEVPVFDGSALAGDGRLCGLLVTGSWLHFKGLELCNVPAPRGTSYGMWIKGAERIIVEQLNLHHNGGPGLFIDGGRGGHLVVNCDSHNNYDPNSGTGPGQNADGFGCHYQREGPSTLFRGCRAWWNSDDGFDWFKQEVPVITENCWAMGSGYTPEGAAFAKNGNGAGFKMGNTFTGVRHVIRNCISIRNKAQGFYANHSHGGSDWLNNTAFANHGAAFDMLSDVELAGNRIHKLRNNLADPSKIRNLGASDTRNNSWDLKITPEDEDFISVMTEDFLKPRQADGQLPATDFLRFRNNGRLTDKGVDVGLPFKGSAPDLGAQESGL